ncbi:DUF4252 domain-containing protein [Dysgonomonas sp. 25]|uniref:DUF4252 domain-containing protein n=1 Tax=Dysgonomonas sp. 25 TaxID=2302933 RepID=UPI0013D0003D|nr:DUF4252 domain-containing protein [Dysgonomonas sp. 25]NDV67343.1 DUF4252 domain-containing protein [Dysgonomonas sp. 25]
MKLKTIIITCILFFSAIGMYAQDNKLFERFSNNKEITSVYISKSILRLAPSMDLGDANISNLIGKLDKLEIYTSENPSAVAMMKKEAASLMKGKTYESLMTVKDGDENVDFLIMADGQNIKEFLMVTAQPNECTIMRILGNFTMEDIQMVMSENKDGKKK